MTMHLARGLSTINTRKPKVRKLTKAKIQQLQEDLRLHNKSLKQQGRHSEQLTFEQYVDYSFGKKIPATPKFKPLNNIEPYRRSSANHIPSASTNSSTNATAKKEPVHYTGERKLLGIATMHKSNLVPVFEDKEFAKDLAKMRR